MAKNPPKPETADVPTGGPAVMPEFSDAQGLDALLAAGPARKPVQPTPEPGKPEQAEGGFAWPPPETPPHIKVAAKQLDFIATEGLGVALGTDLEQEPAEFTDGVADGCWPLVHAYTSGDKPPTKGVLWFFAGFAVFGLVASKLIQHAEKKKEAAKALPPHKVEGA